MLVHPEISALLNRLSQTERPAPKSGPRVRRGGEASKGGLEKPKAVTLYQPEDAEREGEVDYLNERESRLNCYA